MNRKNIFKNSISVGIVALFCFVFAGGILAQQVDVVKFKGIIVNEYGQPIEGALISTDNGSSCTTGTDGMYEIALGEGEVNISARGYLDRRTTAADITAADRVTLNFDPHNMGGTIDLGYYRLSRAAFSGSAVSTTGDELNKMPTNVLSETFSGRLPGLWTKQSRVELTHFGYTNVVKAIRGINSLNGYLPTVIIDGVNCPSQYWEFISPKEIESVSVVKDGASSALYGIQGATGILVITTKRGFNGKPKVEAFGDYSYQEMLNRPYPVGSLDYVTMRNQAGVNDGLGAYSQFSQSDVEGFTSGDPAYFPNNNWMDMFIKKHVWRQRLGVNIQGGSSRVAYFANLSAMNQEEPIRVADEPERKYDPTPRVQVINFRTNIDVDLNNYLSGYMRLTGNVKREFQAGGGDNTSLYGTVFALPPTMYGPLTPIDTANVAGSDQVVTSSGTDNATYGLINRSGFIQYIEVNVIAQAGLRFDMDFLVKGLSAEGSLAYQTYLRNNTNSTQSFERWMRSNDFSKLDFSKKGSTENTPLAYGYGTTFFYNLNLMGQLNYNRRFGEHSVNAMGYIFYQQQEKEITSGAGILPYKRESLGITATYGYRDRYFVTGSLGYSGSEQFAKENRYIATPGVSAAWIVTNEDFMQAVPVLSLLKLRASYALGANDQISGDRFLYLDNISSNGSEGLMGNPDLTAEQIKMQNYGIDLGLLNQITLSFDYFNNRTDNMLISAGNTVPQYQGVSLGNYPKLNAGKMENKGFEIALSYNKHLSDRLSIFGTASFMQAVNKLISVNETPYAEDYPYRYHSDGYPIGQQWGLLINRSNGNGYYNSEEELAAYGLKHSNGTPRVGDFIYYDLNSDGEISEKDYVPMGHPSTIPQQVFSLFVGANYKGFELSLLLQGVNKTSFFLSGLGAYENYAQGYFSDIHQNAYTPERYAAGLPIDYPALSLANSTSMAANDFFLQNGAYLRLKNAEIAYNFTGNWLKYIGADKFRIAVQGMNLLTFDKLMSKYTDPEIRGMGGFQPYRVYNLNLSLIF